ncbi:MAG: hypothetical protein Q8O83_02215 [bacterium]|nr:hypothetical protein [bacterium]
MNSQLNSIQTFVHEKMESAIEQIENIGSPILTLKTSEGYLIVKKNSFTENLIREFGDGSLMYTATGAHTDYFEIFSMAKKIFDGLFYQFSPNLKETYDVHADFITEIIHEHMLSIIKNINFYAPQRAPYAVDMLLAENSFFNEKTNAFDKVVLYSIYYKQNKASEEKTDDEQIVIQRGEQLIRQKINDDAFGLPFSFFEKVTEKHSYSPMPEEEALDFIRELKRKRIFGEASENYTLEIVSATPNKFKRIEI